MRIKAQFGWHPATGIKLRAGTEGFSEASIEIAADEGLETFEVPDDHTLLPGESVAENTTLHPKTVVPSETFKQELLTLTVFSQLKFMREKLRYKFLNSTETAEDAVIRVQLEIAWDLINHSALIDVTLPIVSYVLNLAINNVHIDFTESDKARVLEGYTAPELE